jgi:hypothetical protein
MRTRRGGKMTVPTAVDRSAPVIALHEIDIEAPLDTVWKLHLDVNAWPTWQSDITAHRWDARAGRLVRLDELRVQCYVDCLRPE